VSLEDGYHDVPPGKVVAIVTHLEMRAPAKPRPARLPTGWQVNRADRPDLEWYRTLFHDVGHPWLWFSRLFLTDEALRAAIHDPDVEIWTLTDGTHHAALLELSFRTPGECELCFLGLAPALIGQGAGTFLMNLAIQQAWSREITRLRLQTGTFDSPQALPFYLKSGFVTTHQQVEIADDPRLTGHVPADAAPHVPVFRP
jgi:GNAT superfamily N-acetyltransferase